MKVTINHKHFGTYTYDNVRLIQKHPKVAFMKSDVFIRIGDDLTNLEIHCLDSETLYGIKYTSSVNNKTHDFRGI